MFQQESQRSCSSKILVTYWTKQWYSSSYRLKLDIKSDFVVPNTIPWPFQVSQECGMIKEAQLLPSSYRKTGGSYNTGKCIFLLCSENVYKADIGHSQVYTLASIDLTDFIST